MSAPGRGLESELKRPLYIEVLWIPVCLPFTSYDIPVSSAYESIFSKFQRWRPSSPEAPHSQSIVGVLLINIDCKSPWNEKSYGVCSKCNLKQILHNTKLHDLIVLNKSFKEIENGTGE